MADTNPSTESDAGTHHHQVLDNNPTSSQEQHRETRADKEDLEYVKDMLEFLMHRCIDMQVTLQRMRRGAHRSERCACVSGCQL